MKNLFTIRIFLSLLIVAISSNTFAQSSVLTVSPGCSLSVNNATIKIGGAVTSTGTFDVTNGTVEMNGTASQIIPAGTFARNTIKHLIISNDVSLLGEDTLTGVLSMTGNNKTFSTNNFLTLKSTATGTAGVADLTNNNTNSGNLVLGEVTVERYISAQKKWRFLSIPTESNQTIKEAWQEGCAGNVNCIPNFGTQITGPGSTAAGFDIYSATPSIKTYNTATNTFTAVSNTNAALINNPSNNTISYFVFVRGDRNAIAFNSPITPTVLRTKGVIKQDTQAPITIAAPQTAFTAVGNPYPSRISLLKMTPVPSISTRIYVWDPLATMGCAYGVGAYQTLTYDGSSFSVTPGGGSYDPPYNADPNFIESGGAFFVAGNTAPYDIIFKEDIKADNTIAGPNRIRRSLKANLFVNINGALTLMDGITADIGSDFSNRIDDGDASKISNSTESVSLKRNGQLLSVERHNNIAVNDTFYLNLGNMRVQDYQWQLKMNNLDQPGMTAFLEDDYLHTSVPVNLAGSTAVNFKVLNVPASYASNRFRIVFKQAPVLPVTFTSIKAYPKNSNINIEWDVENEINMKHYEVEKSRDGIQFTKLSVVAASANAGSSKSYMTTDTHPIDGYNYYRIKSVSQDSRLAYTSVVKVLLGKGKEEINVYPNPLISEVISIQLNNMPAGKYAVNLINSLGQTVIQKTLQHTEGSSTQLINIDKNMPHGVYQLQVIKPDNDMVTNKLIY